MVDEELVTRLHDADPAERKKALDDVGLHPDPDHLALLIEALADRASPVRSHARRILKRLTGRDYAFARDQWNAWWRESAHLTCQTCEKRLFDQKLYYRVKADVTSEPREIVLTEEDLAGDTRQKIQEIAEALADTPPEELEEEVWVRLEYYLCVACKKTWVRAMKRRKAQ